MKPFVVLVCVLSLCSGIVVSDNKVMERRQDSYLHALQDSNGNSNGDFRWQFLMHHVI